MFWRSSDERQKRHDMMCREAQDAIAEAHVFLLDVWTTGWNIILNTVSVVAVAEAKSVLVIFVSGVVSSLLVHFASGRIAQIAVSEIFLAALN